MTSRTTSSKLLLSDHPFLTFLNTIADDGKSRDKNLFHSEEELITLLRANGVQVPDAASDGTDFMSVLMFREAAFEVLSAKAGGRSPERKHQRVVEDALKTAIAEGAIVFEEAGIRWAIGQGRGLKDAMALEMIDLTNSPDFERLSECHRCTRLFIDRGRGRGRRWCDMSTCGNRAKAESFRARRKFTKAF